MRRLALPDRETQLRVLRFLAVGGSSAMIQFPVLAWLKTWLSPTTAFTISWVISTLAHYLANRFWALRSVRSDTAKQLGEYLFAVGLSWVINVTAFKIGHDWLGLSVMWAAFWSIPPSTIVVFLLLNYRVFKAPHRRTDEL